MSYSFKTKYAIGEPIFLNVEGSDEYLITNIVYNVYHNAVEYETMNSYGTKDWHTELELTKEKIQQL